MVVVRLGGGDLGLARNRGAQENRGAPKQNTFYGHGYIYSQGSQKNHRRPNGFLMGTRASERVDERESS